MHSSTLPSDNQKTRRRKQSERQLDGLLLVDKQTGHTSHDVVRQARRSLGQRKIGHCGTLDPEATGLLLLTLGKATRLTRFLIRAPKVYEGEVRFGVETDTYDAAGTVVAEVSTGGLEESRIREVMASFEGQYMQTPPPYCAKKIGGQKYYELARRGEEVPRDSKPVQVYEFTLQGGLADDRIRFRLACSSGTYARSLAHHLGQELGCGGHLSALRRTRIGHFELEKALPVARLAEPVDELEELGAAWVPFDRIELPFPTVDADLRQERRIRHGQTILVSQLEGEEGDWVRISGPRGEFLAVGTLAERLSQGNVAVVQPRIVFRT